MLLLISSLIQTVAMLSKNELQGVTRGVEAPLLCEERWCLR